MTICAGFVSRDGIVLAADSQETVGVMKFGAPKLVILPSIGQASDKVRMAFAGAGSGPFIDKLVQKMWEAAQRGPDMSHAAVLDRVEDANLAWHQKVWSVYGKEDRPEVEILVAIHTPGEVNLYKTNGPIFSPPVEDHAFVGIGGELGNFLAEQVLSGYDDLQDAISAVLYIIESAKEYVDGCGGDTQLAAMMADGSIHTMWRGDLEKMANIVTRIYRSVRPLFADAANLERTKADITRTSRFVLQEIHEDRAELRREVKKMIRVPSAVKNREFRYAKIEWPPTKQSASRKLKGQP